MEYAEIVRGLLPPDLVARVGFFLEQHLEEVDGRGQFSLFTRLQPAMRAIPQHLNAQPLLFGMLKTEKLYCHWPPMARWVEPGHGLAMWPMHRDTDYNSHIEGDFLTVWCPLVPIDEACGGLTTEDGPLAPLDPGDVVILSKDCMHASTPNTSSRPRLSCDFRLFGEGATSTKHYLDLDDDCIVEPVHV